MEGEFTNDYDLASKELLMLLLLLLSVLIICDYIRCFGLAKISVH